MPQIIGKWMRVKPCGGHIAVCSDMDGASPQQNLQLKRACCVSHMCLLISFITTTVRQRTSIKMTKKRIQIYRQGC